MDEDDDDMFQPAYARAAGGDEGWPAPHTLTRTDVDATMHRCRQQLPSEQFSIHINRPELADAKPAKKKAVKKRAASGSRPSGVKKPRKAPVKKAAAGTKSKAAAKPRAKK